MIMTRSRNSSRAGSPVRRGGSPVRRGGDDDDRSPSPSSPLRESRDRMRTPSAIATKSAAKSDLPARGRTMTRSPSRAASRGGSPKAVDNVKSVAAAAAAAHYQPLDAKYPDRVRAPSVSRRGYSGSSPDFSSSRLGRASAKRDKVSNATMAVASTARSRSSSGR